MEIQIQEETLSRKDGEMGIGLHGERYWLVRCKENIINKGIHK